jgi:hypothetical protein
MKKCGHSPGEAWGSVGETTTARKKTDTGIGLFLFPIPYPLALHIRDDVLECLIDRINDPVEIEIGRID